MSTTNIVRPACLGSLRVGAGEQDAVVRDVRQRRPDLLAVDHPVVAVPDGGGAQRRQVGAGRRLAEQLAPDVVGPQQAGEVPLPLVVAAVGDDGRPAHAQADVVDQSRYAGADQLLLHDRLLHQRAALPAVLAGPADAHQTGLVQHALRPAQVGLGGSGVHRLLPRADVQQLGGVLLERPPDTGPVLGFLGGVVEVHEPLPPHGLSPSGGSAAA
jgi:hypothetical protein